MEPSHTESVSKNIYIVGAGAIGKSLAVNLIHSGRSVTAVRTSDSKYSWDTAKIAVQCNEEMPIEAAVVMVSLSRLQSLSDGIIVITAKATANRLIAAELKRKKATGPIIIMQNGIGVESPFMDSGFSEIYRCVLYATSQEREENFFRFRSVTASPIGTVKGDARELRDIVEQLSTSRFQFRVEDRIREETWKKTVMNAVFNLSAAWGGQWNILPRQKSCRYSIGDHTGNCRGDQTHRPRFERKGVDGTIADDKRAIRWSTDFDAAGLEQWKRDGN
jgi:ketopantoate reductase